MVSISSGYVIELVENALAGRLGFERFFLLLANFEIESEGVKRYATRPINWRSRSILYLRRTS